MLQARCTISDVLKVVWSLLNRPSQCITVLLFLKLELLVENTRLECSSQLPIVAWASVRGTNATYVGPSMSEQKKRSFPYHSAIPSIDLKRRAVEGINPGQESSSPAIFQAPALAEIEGVSLCSCQTLLGGCAVDHLTATDICRCHALGHEHYCCCSSLEQLTSQAGLMTNSRYAHTSMSHCGCRCASWPKQLWGINS